MSEIFEPGPFDAKLPRWRPASNGVAKIIVSDPICFRRAASVPVLEELYFPLVLLCRFPRLERTQIAPLAGLGVRLDRVEPVFAGLEFPDHGLPPSDQR